MLIYNPHITVSSPFAAADLPTLFCWRQRMRKQLGEPEEDLETFMEERLNRSNVKTFAAYRDEELGGYFEAIPGETSFTDQTATEVAKVEMVFKREFFKRRPEKNNGVGGQDTTQPALNSVLLELFDDFELMFFPLAKQNRPIHQLVTSVGAACIGAVEDNVMLFMLSRPEWERRNGEFITQYEAAHPVEVAV